MSNTPRNEQLMAETRGMSDTQHLIRLDRLSRELEHENSQLIKDRDRLDWIEKARAQCGYSDTTYIGEAYFAHALAMGDKYDAGKTIREAIDAAMRNG